MHIRRESTNLGGRGFIPLPAPSRGLPSRLDIDAAGAQVRQKTVQERRLSAPLDPLDADEARLNACAYAEAPLP